MTNQWISSGLEWDWWGFFVFVQSLLGFPAADTVTCVIYNTPTWNMSRVADEIQCWLIPSGVHEAKQSELCTCKDWLRTEDENRSFPEMIVVLSRSQKGKGSIRNYMERNREDYDGTTVQMQNLHTYWRVCTVLMEVREWELERVESLQWRMRWGMKWLLCTWSLGKRGLEGWWEHSVNDGCQGGVAAVVNTVVWVKVWTQCTERSFSALTIL